MIQYSLNRMGNSVHVPLIASTAFAAEYSNQQKDAAFMLYDQQGNRKYLTRSEREAFLAAARRAAPEIETFCLTLAYTGARISEVLALHPMRIDTSDSSIVIECLKKRKRGVYRTVPVPSQLLVRLDAAHKIVRRQNDTNLNERRLWPWSRTTAWKRVKTVMRAAGIVEERATPKALRHAFGVGGTQSGVPLNIIQRWLGHADIETTAIYADAVGDEERHLAERMWS